MPFWDGPFTMLPAFEATAEDGTLFRTADRRQFKHLAVAFADADSPSLSDLAARRAEIRENNGDLVIVAPSGADIGLPDRSLVVRDVDGAIATKYRPILPEWHPPVVFVGDRYGELTAVTDGRDPDLAGNVTRWIFSNEVQCDLCET